MTTPRDRIVPWTRELAGQYDSDAPTVDQTNAMVIYLGGLCEALGRYPEALATIGSDGALELLTLSATATPAGGGGPVQMPKVGQLAKGQLVAALGRTDERARYQLALAQCMREIKAREPRPSAGWAVVAGFAIRAVAVVVVGLVAKYLVDRVEASTASSEVRAIAAAERARHVAIAAAAESAVRRYETRRTSGVLPPPEPIETAAAAALEQAAGRAREDRLGGALAGAVSGVGKVVAVGVGVLVVKELLS